MDHQGQGMEFMRLFVQRKVLLFLGEMVTQHCQSGHQERDFPEMLFIGNFIKTWGGNYLLQNLKKKALIQIGL